MLIKALLIVHFTASPLFHNFFLSTKACLLPDSCQFKKYHAINSLWANKYFSDLDFDGIRCEIPKTQYRFDYEGWRNKNQIDSCKINCQYISTNVRFSKVSILDSKFNIQGLIDIMHDIGHHEINESKPLLLTLSNLKKIDVDLGFNLLSKNLSATKNNPFNFYLFIINARLDFYANGQPITSCQDMIDANATTPNTLFQILPTNEYHEVFLLNSKFVRPLCPFIFKNSRIYRLAIYGMIDSYFKRNILRIENKTIYDNDSQISKLHFFKNENIELDSRLLNPSVFYRINELRIYCSIKRIDNEILKWFPRINFLYIEGFYFQKLIHRQGIKWIRAINQDFHVNVTNQSAYEEFGNRVEHMLYFIDLGFYFGNSFQDFLPDADFCLYKDFPFDQMVVIMQSVWRSETTTLMFDWKPTCTFRWLTQYHQYAIKFINSLDQVNIKLLMEAGKKLPPCDFETRIKLCERKKFEAHFLWDMSDTKRLSDVTMAVLNISSYLISIFGIITNSIVAYVILSKKTKEIFKDLKQYPYLASISIYNIIMLLIEIISWICDCKDFWDVLCPKSGKYIPIQFFKVIFKESLMIALRFMSNFSYIAFALNRVSMIGKDHPKLVTFMSKVNFKRYTLLTGFISIILSVVKGFKYHINYDHSEQNYPFSIEEDFFSAEVANHVPKNVYLVINMICDLLNYLLFVIVNVSIDIYMLLRLRKTLIEKLNRFKEEAKATSAQLFAIKPGQKGKLARKKETEIKMAMNNAIRMVLVNSTLNFFFKLPLLILPIYNLVSSFYYYSSAYKRGNLYLDTLLRKNLVVTDLIYMIGDLSDWFFYLLISIQLFVYRKFDKKFRTGLDKALNRSENQDKNKNRL